MLVNTDELEITVFGNLAKNEPQELYKISFDSSIQGKTQPQITDMKFLSKNRLVTLSTEGKITVFSITKSEHILLKEFELKSLR